MPLAPQKGFIGESYLLAGVPAACQRLLNLFPEVEESGDEPQVAYLRARPGLAAPLVNLGSGPIRGMCQAGTPLNPLGGSGDAWYVVSGSYLYQLTSAGATTNPVILSGAGTGSRGNVGNDGLPVTLLPNGNQLGIVSAGNFYCDNGGSPGVGPVAQSFPASGFTDIAIGWSGTLNTDRYGKITLASGIPFNAGMKGATITITGYSSYTITRFYVNIITGVATLTCSPTHAPASLTGVAFVAGFAAATQVNSQSTPFGPGDVGATLAFSGGGGFSGSPTIASVDAYGNATLSSSPGGNGLINGIATETYPPFAVSSGAFLDSFYIVSLANSTQFNVSAPLDGTTWDPTDNAVKESYPDKIGTILADHQELLVLGETHSEVWQAPGADPNFPFQPNESFAMAIGVAAPASACSLRDGPVWIGASLRGQPIAYFAQGFAPQRISTHAIEQVWASYSALGAAGFADAQAFVYEMDGHEFWQVTFPTGDATWVYDRMASVQFGKPMWHEENSYDGANYHRHRAMCHCYVFGKHYVGDFSNGNIYQMSSTVYTDNTQVINCIRTFPHLTAQRLRQFFQKWQLDFQTGGGNALTVTLSWSDDGGVNWVGGGSNFTYVASTTKNLDRAVFWQLGSAETRVFSLQITGSAPKTLLNAYSDVLQGIS